MLRRLCAGIPPLLEPPFVSLRLRMIDKDNIVPDAPQIRSILSSGGINKVGICQLTDEVGNLGTHSVLLTKGGMGKSLQNEPLEQGSIQVETIPFLDGEKVMIDFGP